MVTGLYTVLSGHLIDIDLMALYFPVHLHVPSVYVLVHGTLVWVKSIMSITATIIEKNCPKLLAHLWGAYAIPVALSGVRRSSYVVCRLCPP